jgi:methylated-DNA-[protein]-cysteine S-methyltransferase
MSRQGFALFDTAIGVCAIAWSEYGVCGVQLPERREQATRHRVRRRFPDAVEKPPNAAIQRAIDGIVASLRGEARDLSFVTLDMEGVSPFRRSIYAVLRGIPPGSALSYGEIATRLGGDATARDVGEAMGENPFPIIVPCHRVVGSGGRIGGFSANGGIATKLRLLNIERAELGGPAGLFDRLPLAVRPRRR